MYAKAVDQDEPSLTSSTGAAGVFMIVHLKLPAPPSEKAWFTSSGSCSVLITVHIKLPAPPSEKALLVSSSWVIGAIAKDTINCLETMKENDFGKSFCRYSKRKYKVSGFYKSWGERRWRGSYLLQDLTEILLIKDSSLFERLHYCTIILRWLLGDVVQDA